MLLEDAKESFHYSEKLNVNRKKNQVFIFTMQSIFPGNQIFLYRKILINAEEITRIRKSRFHSSK